MAGDSDITDTGQQPNQNTLGDLLAKLNSDELKRLLVHVSSMIEQSVEANVSKQQSQQVTEKTKKRKTAEDTPKLTTSAVLSTQYSVPTSNKYGSLANNNMETENQGNTSSSNASITPSQSSTQSNPTKRIHPLNQTDTETTEANNIPPLILREKEKWRDICNLLKTKKLNYTRATNVKDGISVTPASETDYRSMYKLFETEKFAFHTYQLRSEKLLKVVLRNVPQYITCQEIAEDLAEKNYEIEKVTRLNGRDDKPAPLVVVELDKKYKAIYNLTNCCGLAVTIESKKVHKRPIQCHRCQLYGHTQPFCHAPYKCMKCAENHSTHECKKPITTPAKCSNCLGEHTANNPTCPSYPSKNKTNLAQPSKSYSNVIKHNQPLPQPQSSDSFAATLGNMLITLYSCNPSQEQVNNFIKHSQTLYNIYSAK